jgi:thermitase
MKALPGLKKLPRDLNCDGTYDDLDGSGKLDANDVILFVRYFQRIYGKEPRSAFVFNHHGRMDMRDFMELAQVVVLS